MIPDITSNNIAQNYNPYMQIFNSWNLRKSSALTLDIMAEKFGDIIAPKIFERISEFLNKPQWKYLEAANLLLGAVAKGFEETIPQYTNQLLPLIFSSCSNENFVVRSTSAWALSCFSDHIFSSENFQSDFMKIVIYLSFSITEYFYYVSLLS